MQAAPLSNNLKRLFRFCLVLVGLFLVINVIIGYSANQIHNEVKEVEHFLELAEDVRPNFEESLNLYTAGAEESIQYVKTLRPDSENEYIQFISTVEAIGEQLSLHLDLESVEGSNKTSPLGNVIHYGIQFYGGQEDLNRFLETLEALPYFIRVDEVHYDSFELADDPSDVPTPNIDLLITLYVQ